MQSTTSRDGTRIAYARSGHGPALLLVHGTTADHTRWAPLLAELNRRFTVYAMDRRGRGGSGDTLPYAVEREFEDVAAVVDAIGGPVVLLGHSYGAVCALEASLRTANLRKLILYEPPIPMGTPFYPPALLDTIARFEREGRHDEIVSTFFLEVAKLPPHELDLLRGLPNWPARVAAAPTILREMQLDRSYVFKPESFSAMRTPTLLLLGGASPKMFTDAVHGAQAALPASHVVVLPGQGHTAMNTAPELFLAEVVRFIDAP